MSAPDDRRSVRVVLLLLLLVMVAAWGYMQTLPPMHKSIYRPLAITVEERQIDGQTVRQTSNVPYARIPAVAPERLCLDIYAPTGARGLPVLVYLHGGGWSAGDKTGIGPKAGYFATHGFVVISMNYRFSPPAKISDSAADVASSIDFVRRTVGQYGGDPDKIFLLGHSAGAHLAALAVCDDRYLARYQLTASAVRGMILLDGSAYSVPALMQTLRGATFEYVFGSDEQQWREDSPVYFVNGSKRLPPTLLFHAGDDMLRATVAWELAGAMEKSGADAKVVHIGERDHISIDALLGNDQEPVTREIMDFVQRQTGAK